MIREIAAKDLLESRRESLVVVLTAVCVVLLAAGTFIGTQRDAEFARERTAAELVDREVWLNQGERNPHSAAHFSRYAFRSSSPLSLVDPGINDYAGIALWMEAHFQNPAEFRRAEDSGELARSVQLSPATLFLVALPLLIFVAMCASVAGEREDGTLRQLIASGISGRAFFLGKMVGGLRLVLPGFLVLSVAVTAVALARASAPISLDAVARSASMLALYLLYVLCCAAVAIGVSALFRTRQAALLTLICVWALMTVVAPRLAADLGRTLYPSPDARVVSAQLQAASDIYYADAASQEAIRQAALDEYGVTAVEDLPISYGAYVLQRSEELSFPEFERVFGLIDQRHSRQSDVARTLTPLTPLIPARNLSRGFAGTDLAHQAHFVNAAEDHRREMIRMLNEDYMYNSGEAGSEYTAGREVWEQFRDFSYQPLPLGQAWRLYLLDAALLLAWVIAASGAAFVLVRRALRAEGAS